MRLSTDAAQDLKAGMADTIREAGLRPKKLSEMVEETLAVSEAMMESLGAVNRAKEEFYPTAKAYKQELLAFRMSVVTELTVAQRAFEDVRKFFLNPNHDQEVQKLREFVELCERLKRLKDSGFLDAVADTMLKL